MLKQILTNDGLYLKAAGAWTAANAHLLESYDISELRRKGVKESAVLDVGGIKALDTYGAWLIERLVRRARACGLTLEIVNLPERFTKLVQAVHVTHGERKPAKRTGSVSMFLETIGRFFPQFAEDLAIFAETLGAIFSALLRVVIHPRRFRLTSAVHHFDRVGWQAMPIMLLISFLIGAIIAQQGIFHFRKFGADTYVVDLVGILVLREIGVLLIAIMSAGRSGSSYTAELGSMKMREEIDAVRTMGLDPVEVLMLPRVLALIVAVPVLVFFGSLAALYGGGLVAWLYGGMSPAIFISRLQEAVSVNHFEVGIIKAPFMALVIGIVACGEGLRVKGSAESLGKRTTTSVVKSIFLVIVLDGLFAIFFASIGM
ncbi:MAG TPA: MlaE family lipid ABC transporter permease subunit [Pseudolabrys sp.]|jgi:phospholipid/cholesterol/gamma-HCH transport system permease protein|nr:MlaE family lipid ABC transporter permease subunit [Pseudolabrys sp.]